MSSQLALKIIPRLPYSPEHFVLHAGASEVMQDSLALIASNHYGLLWILAGPRQGKTHLSVRLSSEVANRKIPTRLFEGKEFTQWISRRFESTPISESEVIIVDDAQEYFLNVLPGNSGDFVALVEEMRFCKAKLILISSASVESLPCDEHIMTRLRAGYKASIQAPQDVDFPLLVGALSRQRGLSLTEARIQFVAKRVRRQISDLEDYLNRVSHLSTVLNRSVTRPLLSDAL